MKILSVRAPWSWLIIHGGKDIENRTWRTSLRGRIGIHASGTLSFEEWMSAERLLASARARGIAMPELPKACIDTTGERLKLAGTPKGIVLGAIIGTVELVDCVDHSDSPWFQGKYGFVLRDPQPLASPIPARGMLSFWDYEIPLEVAA